VEGAAVTNQIAGALVERILAAAKKDEKFKVRTWFTFRWMDLDPFPRLSS
jgi:hypothetical protein